MCNLGGVLCLLSLLDRVCCFLRVGNDVSILLPRRAIPTENAMFRSGQQRTVICLRQREDISAIQSLAALLPRCAAVLGDEYAAVAFVIQDARVDRAVMFCIRKNRSNLVLRETLIRSSKGCAGITAQ